MPYDRILDLSSVPGYANVHVLGVFARRLTVYSQQTRAINLVDAIHWYRRPLKDLEVAVVGAGAAGLTAAAYAAERYGARITLIERLQQVLEIQNKSERWLHPTLFEWPARGLDPAERTTSLPVMNWTAGTAQQVADTLAAAWRTASAAHGVATEFNSQVVRLDGDPARPTLHWRLETKERQADRSRPFDVVIFAVGFGLEPKGPNRRSYWENDALSKTLGLKESVLVGGYGDGALIDLIRASLAQFDHQTVLTSIVAALDAAGLARVQAIEQHRYSRDAAYLTREYVALDLPAVRAVLAPLLNATRKVFLTGRGPHLFEPGASAINRVIASQLLRLAAFTHLPLDPDERVGDADETDPVFVRLLQAAGVAQFDTVVLRFGVERTITQIDGLSLDALQREWDKVPPNDDPTRVRLWELVTPIAPQLDCACLLFTAPSTSNFVQDVVELAVADLQDAQDTRFHAVSLTECFASDEALAHTVRALCRAPIAIFPFGPELGREALASVLLLGIRAVVRRGATLVVQEGSLSAALWRDLPFNLKEMQIYALDSKNLSESAARLTNAIKEGLRVLGTNAAGYRDTPVFDIVRRAAPSAANAPAGEREVFLFCSFADAYEQTWQWLKLQLNGRKDRRGLALSVRRVIDYAAPLLAGERLYERTRHAGDCVADLTEWSLNVFFEVGVRLAVGATPPLCLLRHSSDPPDRVTQQLIDRLKPLVYTPGVSANAFRESFLDRLDELKRDARAVYGAAERNVILNDEYGGTPVYAQLFSTVQSILGPDLANLRLLYGRNPHLRRQVLESGQEALLAAKLLVEHKRQSSAEAHADKALNDLLAQIESLLDEVRDLNAPPRQAG